MKKYGVIMAGGGGTRFWPLSRKERPKQLLNLSGKDVMVNETIDRVIPSVGEGNVFIVTNVSQAELMQEETKGRLKPDHILAEPAARNTAACIGYAAMEIIKKHGDGVMVVLPSDHFIKDTEEYTRVLDAAIEAAQTKDALVTIGIRPTFPATGYGYIKAQSGSRAAIGTTGKEYYKVEEFVEKPDEETAKKYLEAGNYTWNSGVFIWKASVILKRFEALLPDVYECLTQIGDAMGTEQEKQVLWQVYPTIPKISVDYGIMERSKDVITIAGDFGWNDIGSLDMLDIVKGEDENGNVLYGEQVNVDTKNCIVYGEDKLIATIGLDNLIIVQTKDAVLVCEKSKAQDVKKVVDILTENGLEQYL